MSADDTTGPPPEPGPSQRGPKTDRMREICEALPEVHAEITWGSDLNFRVRKKIFCFPGEERMTVKADDDEREALLADPRFELAAYVGRFGWVTMDVGGEVDWDEVTELIHTSYCLVAPKTLARRVAGPER